MAVSDWGVSGYSGVENNWDGSFSVVINGQKVGDSYYDLPTAQQAFNSLMGYGAPTTPSGAAGGAASPLLGAGFDWAQLFASMLQNATQQSYLRDVFGLDRNRWLTELGSSPRNWIQFWQGNEALNNPGYQIPQSFVGGGLANSGVGMPGVSSADIGDVRAQLADAGWSPQGAGDADAVAAFLRIVKGDQGGLVSRLRQAMFEGVPGFRPKAPKWLQKTGGFDALQSLLLSERDFNAMPSTAQQGLVGAAEWMGQDPQEWFKRQGWANFAPSPAGGYRY